MATRNVIPPGVGRAARATLESIGMSKADIDEGVRNADGLKERDMTPQKYPCLDKISTAEQQGEFYLKLIKELTANGVTENKQLVARAQKLKLTGELDKTPKFQHYGFLFQHTQVGVAAEDLNATLQFLKTPGFQPWKALVNMLRFIKTAEEGRIY